MRIAIVNDMPLAVEALRRALSFEPAHEVVWVASNGLEAVQRCADWHSTPKVRLEACDPKGFRRALHDALRRT